MSSATAAGHIQRCVVPGATRRIGQGLAGVETSLRKLGLNLECLMGDGGWRWGRRELSGLEDLRALKKCNGCDEATPLSVRSIIIGSSQFMETHLGSDWMVVGDAYVNGYSLR